MRAKRRRIGTPTRSKRTDAAAIGFDDWMLYNELTCDLADRKVPIISLGREEALKVFEQWKNKEDKVAY